MDCRAGFLYQTSFWDKRRGGTYEEIVVNYVTIDLFYILKLFWR